MTQTLTTVATFHQPAQAELAKNALEEAGIPAAVADSEIVAMDWLLANAVGGIKVQVRTEDADRAAEVLHGALGESSGLASEAIDEDELARQALTADPGPDDEPDDAADELAPAPSAGAEAVSEPEPAADDPTAEREAFARQLLFVAAIGWTIPPLLFYALYMMLNALFGTGGLSGRGRLNVVAGGLVTVFGLATWFLALHIMTRPDW